MNPETAAVMEFLSDIDAEAWRKKLPITGDRDIDARALQGQIVSFVASGLPASLLDLDIAPSARLAFKLVSSALQSVDWDHVLKIWEVRA